MKSKDVLDVLANKGIALKSQATLEVAQFEMLFDTLTRNNQIDNIGNYLDGVTYIPSKKPVEKEPQKAEQVKPEAAPAAPVVQEKPVAEQKSADSASAVAPKNTEQVQLKEKTAPAAAKPAPQKPEQPKNAQPKTEQPKNAQPKNEQPKSAPVSKTAEIKATKPQVSAATSSQRQAQGQKLDSRFDSTPKQDGRGGFGQNGAKNNNNRNDRFGGNNAQRGPAGKPQQRGGEHAGGWDKEDKQSRGPVEKFKPQPIVRSQTVKGTDSTPKQRGATRVVDMRAESVDLSKYDERLDTFVPDAVADVRGGNQRVKKQGANNRMQQGGFGGARGKDKFKGKKSTQPVTKAPTSVTLPDEIMVSDLASRLKVTSAEVVKRLMMLGMMVTVNQTVDYDTAAIVADEMGIAVTKEVVVTIEEKLFDEQEDTEETLVPRAPVVCVMGHVDHGKTSILDAIRHTNVTTGEAGGITQHIGAYRVKANGQDITFLDTPGHEAFTAMRARGAQATDIAILVVAADDGIMPQTVEAINHAKAAGIDIIVAINKMDKPTANPDAVKQELTKYDLVPEEWGGDVICVPVSALTGMGIDDLLENVLLVAEVKELKANPKRRAKGIVIEAKLDKGRGPVATVLVQNGTLRSGDIVIAGTSVGHVRAMTDHNGRTLKEAGPSVPVEIIGLAEVPSSGDEFNVVADERMARELADQRREKAKEEVFKANARANLNDLFAQIADGVKQLNVIVKADVGGSAEAVKQSLEKISNDEVKVCVIHAAAGGIREGDVTFAAASNAIIVGFNVRPDKVAIDSAERQNVDIRTYRVIYDCINEITDAMKGMLAPEFKEVILGHAEVRQTIHVPNVGTIAGSYIQDGKVSRSAMIRVVRDGIVIFEDKISSLKRFKDDAKEVAQGYECGIGLDRFNDIKVGDILEAYVMEEIAR